MTAQPRKQQKKIVDRTVYEAVDLAVFREAHMAKHADDKGGIPIVLSPDKTIYIPPAERWSDEAVESVDVAPVRWARAVLGDDYDAYVEAGGTAMMLNAILAQATGVTSGESPAS